MQAQKLTRLDVLAYRAAVHDLEQPAPSTIECGVLEVGVQDTPAGTTAQLALAARARSTEHDLTRCSRLVLVHSLRAAMHVHRADDLCLLRAALRPDDPAERDAVDLVAQAMAEVTADGQLRSKGELSAQITPLLPRRLHSWCEVCGAEHVPDGLFRASTLVAGLRLQTSGNRSARFHRAPAPGPVDSDTARRELTRRFLRRCGAGTVSDLATWTGTALPAAKTWWSLLADELVEVEIDGKRLWMHAEDLAAARATPPPTAVRLLPPYDPWAEVAHRELLLPDPALRRQVWRAVANPGLVLLAGELVGTWRRRRRTITAAPLRPWSDKERRAILDEVAATMPGTEVAYEL